MTAKEEIIQLMQELPDEADVEDTIAEAMDRLYLLYRVERGDRQIAEGKGIPHEEVRQLLAKWRK
jgi:predicted transcriptional regulator